MAEWFKAFVLKTNIIKLSWVQIPFFLFMIYSKNNYLVFINKCVYLTMINFKKNILFLKVDIFKHFCWSYIKKKKKKISLLLLKKKFKWNN